MHCRMLDMEESHCLLRKMKKMMGNLMMKYVFKFGVSIKKNLTYCNPNYMIQYLIVDLHMLYCVVVFRCYVLHGIRLKHS